MIDPPQQGDWATATEEELDPGPVARWVIEPHCGGVALFCGVVRNHSEGRSPITAVEYQAYREYLDQRLRAVVEGARRRWPDAGRLVVLHRIGELSVGDISVITSASTPHRAEAFAAARYLIDTVKETVPIWKKETWPGGSEWALGEHDLADVDGS